MNLSNRGQHPNSIANLVHDGRPQNWGEPKKKRNISITETGWTGMKEVAQSLGLSISELIERIGRDDLILADPDKNTFSKDELAESESAWQDYLSGDDPGLTPDELKAELFG